MNEQQERGFAPEACKNCFFWRNPQEVKIPGTETIAVVGICKEASPRASAIPGGVLWLGVWPLTESTNWCGKWSPTESEATDLHDLNPLSPGVPADADPEN